MTFPILAAMLCPILSALVSAGYPGYRYTRPFLQPLPVWDYWPWLIVPLGIGVSVVYKSLKCRHMRQVPREATILSLWILAGMTCAAGVLMLIVKLVDRLQS